MGAYFVSSRGLASRMVPRSALSPLAQELFGAYEPGSMYDPEITGTLYQDAAGTTPVTAVEQPVGLMLDLSGRGNHATQATTTKRPIYSRRVNLYSSTENLSSVWTLTGATVTASGTSPTGSAAWLMSDSAVTSAHTAVQALAVTNARHLLRLLAKPQGGRYVFLQVGNGADRGNAVFDLQTATVTASTSNGLGAVSFAISPLSDGWLLLSASAMSDAGIRSYSFGISSGPTLVDTSFLGGNTRTILLAEPSLTLATDAHLPYQLVNTATDYDSDPAKFPAYLRFDGVDDALQTGNIDFTSTDKMTVWAGITKLSDAAAMAVVELSASQAVNTGSFYLFAPFNAAPNVGFLARGTVNTSAPAADTTWVAPASFVATGQGLIGADVPNILRTTGKPTRNIANSIGSGTYGNYPLFIGARAGTSLYFNGRLYGLIVRGAQSTLSQIEATELYMKKKVGIA